ncbi:GDP-L-fucose synthase [Patescibacteria group bacterium]|nr:GDP-L-fucose synthase [Patescibacteria group bacterium]MBU1970212.1 GDP-L-fucose synthase [Patescibacteria group bacterium]
MKKSSKIYIAGHRGMVGSAIKRRLEKLGFNNLIYKTRKQLDLTDFRKTKRFLETEQPEYVFVAAARVGGIIANRNYPMDFFYHNMAIQLNLIHAAHLVGVRKLLFMGSTCIYPKLAEQPLKEDHLLTGPLEPTNEAYAIAKIAGIKMCHYYNFQHGTNFITVMPTSLYGPHDNFDLEGSHVIPAMLRKFHEAKVRGDRKVTLWGTGKPRREFMYVDDLADALLFLMQSYDTSELINIGIGNDYEIREIADKVAGVVGYQGSVEYDTSKPDGTPRKLVDTSKLDALGWKPTVGLEEGLKVTYDWFLQHAHKFK